MVADYLKGKEGVAHCALFQLQMLVLCIFSSPK